jgi:hypothetical protein|tara:strand:- start:788 stop:1045 length:258 start_codon:yes stop_codon:yes gene_type:complete
MSWMDILKLMTPREFMESLAEKLDGTMTSARSSNFKFGYSKGSIELKRDSRGYYMTIKDGNVPYTQINSLSFAKVISEAEEYLGL